MKKIGLSLVVLSIVLIGCATAPAFDPNVNPFVGEWRTHRSDLNWDIYFETYIFAENQFTITNTLGRHETGFYEFTRDRITFHTATESWELQYETIGRNRLRLSGPAGTPGPARFLITRLPYYDMGWDLWASAAARNAFPVNEEELASIQGVWRIPGRWQVTYTFTGTNFTLTRHSRAPFPEFISGTLKIDDNFLLLIVNEHLFGFYTYEFQDGNVLFLHEIMGQANSHWGRFVRQ